MREPADAAVRQCAWCRLVMDQSGRYTLRSTRKITSATHGICPSCKALVRAEIERQPATRSLLAA
jgi:hypothetical protein